MRTLVERYCFIYGCVASVGAMFWYLTALAGYAELPQSVWVAESLVLIHGITMVITFHRRPNRSPWAPVLQVTPKRIRIARVVLGAAAANCLFLSDAGNLEASRSFRERPFYAPRQHGFTVHRLRGHPLGVSPSERVPEAVSGLHVKSASVFLLSSATGT